MMTQLCEIDPNTDILSLSHSSIFTACLGKKIVFEIGLLLISDDGNISYMNDITSKILRHLGETHSDHYCEQSQLVWLMKHIRSLSSVLTPKASCSDARLKKQVETDKGKLVLQVERLHAAGTEPGQQKVVVKLYFLKPREQLVEENVANLPLTTRQKQIAVHVGLNNSASAVCSKLGISYSTYKDHLKNIYNRLGINRKEELLYLLG